MARANEVDKKIHECSKPGFFSSENDLIDKIRNETGTGKARNPVAYLVEASDDIVYSTVDLEDGIKKGVISWQTLETEIYRDYKGDSGPADRAISEAHKKIDRAGLSGKELDVALAQAFEHSQSLKW